MLLLAVFMLALLVLSLSVAIPAITKEIQRDREVETMHRGLQYRRAIQLYYRKIGGYPPSVDALVKTNNIRFLRKKYIDPMTGKDDWKTIGLGQNKAPLAMGFFGQPLAGAGGGAIGGIGPSGRKRSERRHHRLNFRRIDRIGFWRLRFQRRSSMFGSSGSGGGSMFGSSSGPGSTFGSSANANSTGTGSTDNSGNTNGTGGTTANGGIANGAGSGTGMGTGTGSSFGPSSGQSFGGGVIGVEARCCQAVDPGLQEEKPLQRVGVYVQPALRVEVDYGKHGTERLAGQWDEWFECARIRRIEWVPIWRVERTGLWGFERTRIRRVERPGLWRFERIGVWWI